MLGSPPLLLTQREASLLLIDIRYISIMGVLNNKDVQGQICAG